MDSEVEDTDEARALHRTLAWNLIVVPAHAFDELLHLEMHFVGR